LKKIILSNDAPAPVGPYSQAILVDGTLYCSGQIAADDLDGDIAVQTEKACSSISAILGAAGMEPQDVVKATCFLADIGDFVKFNEVYEKFFPHKPARSCVGVNALPKGALVEIEVIARKD